MKNYYDKQKASTLAQIDHLYVKKDASFRGFRHNPLGGKVAGEDAAEKPKNVAVQGNEIMDGLVNWESSQTQDSERFSNNHLGENSGIKSTKSFDLYLKRKQDRIDEKRKNTRVNT